MLDIKFIRENPDKVKKACTDKNFDPVLVDNLLVVDTRRRELIIQVEKLRQDRNILNEELKKSRTPELLKQAAKMKEEVKLLENQQQEVELDYLEKLNLIPNLPSDKTPRGKSEKDNVEIRRWGKPTEFDFEPKDHVKLGMDLGILDFETGAKVSGSQFYYLYRGGALLELALVRFAFDFLSKEGFIPVITPDLARSRYYLGTGYAPKGDEAQTYTIENEDLGLIATAEVTLAGKHADETIPESKLPIKYIGYSHCFRQEAGAYGKYSKGLYRVHQFTKAEMFIYCSPEESDRYHEHILEMEEKLYQALGLPYRVLEMCTGDLGTMAARKFDVEAWIPSRNDYGEVTSTSNCTDYQSRNLDIRFRRKSGETDYLHMLNGTAIATSRTPLAILENYQQKDGSIKVPTVLIPYMGTSVIK